MIQPLIGVEGRGDSSFTPNRFALLGVIYIKSFGLPQHHLNHISYISYYSEQIKFKSKN